MKNGSSWCFVVSRGRVAHHQLFRLIFPKQGYIEEIYEDAEFDEEPLYTVITDAGDEAVLERNELVKFDYTKDVPPHADERNITVGTMVLAYAHEKVMDKPFYAGMVVDRHRDGRYKVYFLNDGSFGYLKPNEVAVPEVGLFESAGDARLYDSCEEFYDTIHSTDQGSRMVYRREIGDGCLALVSWPHRDGLSTLLATYDGQIHIEFNAYNSQTIYERARKKQRALVDLIRDRDIEGMDSKQTDFFPRGFGRVVNFQHDLRQDYFGTKYPRQIRVSDD